MRIGVMLRALDERYGIGQYTRNIVTELLRLDDRNEYLLMYRDSRHLGTHAAHPNVKEAVVRARSKLTWDQVAVPRLARRERLDVIFHTKFSVPLFTRSKTIMVLHGSEWFVYPELYPWWDIQYVRFMMPHYLRRADAVISVSNRAKQDITARTGVNPRKIRTVYLAPNERFRVIEDEALLKTSRRKYGLPERFILFVGKIYPGKNLGNTLRAYARIRRQVPHKLVICGDVYWKYGQELRLIDELGLKADVIRAGWIEPEELPAIYNLAELLVFPSRYEGCPSPPWEAMACGCPVVTSPTGGTREVVGGAATLVDPEDVGELAEAVYRVLTDGELRRSLVARGFDQVKNFTWQESARQTLEIIEGLGRTDALGAILRAGELAARTGA